MQFMHYIQQPEPSADWLHPGLRARGNWVTFFKARRVHLLLTYNVVFHKDSLLLQGSKIIKLNVQFLEDPIPFFGGKLTADYWKFGLKWIRIEVPLDSYNESNIVTNLSSIIFYLLLYIFLLTYKAEQAAP
jgi:hypothetical protein